MKCICSDPCETHTPPISGNHVSHQQLHSDHLPLTIQPEIDKTDNICHHQPLQPNIHSSLSDQPPLTSITQPSCLIPPDDYGHDSSSTSPSVSFHEESEDRPPTPVPVKLWSSIRRLFDALVPPKNLRHPPDYSPYFADESNIDHLARSLSSRQSSGEVPGRSISNSFRRLERRFIHTSNDQELQTIGNSQLNQFSIAPPTPASSPRLLRRYPSARSASQINEQHSQNQSKKFRSESGNRDFQIPMSQQMSTVSQDSKNLNSSVRSHYLSRRANNSFSTNPESDFVQLSTSETIPSYSQKHSQSVNSPATPKVFSNRPPKQTTSGVVKVVPSVRKHPGMTNKQLDSFQSSPPILSAVIKRKTGNGLTNSSHGKPPRAPYTRPPAQPIQKQLNSTGRLRKTASLTHEQSQQTSNITGGLRSRNGSKFDSKVNDGSRRDDVQSEPLTDHNINVPSSLPPYAGIQLKLMLPKSQALRSAERAQLLGRSVLGAKEGKRITKKASVPSGKEQDHPWKNEVKPISNVPPFFQAMHERQEQSMKVIGQDEEMNDEFSIDKGMIHELESTHRNIELPPELPPALPPELSLEMPEMPAELHPPNTSPVPEPNSIEILDEESNMHIKEAEEIMIQTPPRKSFLASKKVKPHMSIPNPTTPSQNNVNQSEKLGTKEIKTLKLESQPDASNVLRPRATSAAKPSVSSIPNRKTKLPKMPSATKRIGTLASKSVHQNSERAPIKTSKKTSSSFQKPALSSQNITNVSPMPVEILEKTAPNLSPTLVSKSVARSSKNAQKGAAANKKASTSPQKTASIAHGKSVSSQNRESTLTEKAASVLPRTQSFIQKSAKTATKSIQGAKTERSSNASSTAAHNSGITGQKVLHEPRSSVPTQKSLHLGSRVNGASTIRSNAKQQKPTHSMNRNEQTKKTQSLNKETFGLKKSTDALKKAAPRALKQQSMLKRKQVSEAQKTASNSQHNSQTSRKAQTSTKRSSLLSQRATSTKRLVQSASNKPQSIPTGKNNSNKPPLPRHKPKFVGSKSTKLENAKKGTNLENGRVKKEVERINSQVIAESEVEKDDVSNLLDPESKSDSSHFDESIKITNVQSKIDILKNDSGSGSIHKHRTTSLDTQMDDFEECDELVTSAQGKEVLPEFFKSGGKDSPENLTALDEAKISGSDILKDVSGPLSIRTKVAEQNSNNEAPKQEEPCSSDGKLRELKYVEEEQQAKKVIANENVEEKDSQCVLQYEKINNDDIIMKQEGKTDGNVGGLNSETINKATIKTEKMPMSVAEKALDIGVGGDESQKISDSRYPSKLVNESLEEPITLLSKTFEPGSNFEKTKESSDGGLKTMKYESDIAKLDPVDASEIRANDDERNEQDATVTIMTKERPELKLDGPKEELLKLPNLKAIQPFPDKAQENEMDDEETTVENNKFNIREKLYQETEVPISRDEGGTELSDRISLLKSLSNEQDTLAKYGKDEELCTNESKQLTEEIVSVTEEKISKDETSLTLTKSMEEIQNAHEKEQDEMSAGSSWASASATKQATQVSLYPNKATISSFIEKESVAQRFKIPPIDIPQVSELSLAETRNKQCETPTTVRSDSTCVQPKIMDRETLPLEAESLLQPSAHLQECQDNDDCQRRASDSVYCGMKHARMFTQFRVLSDSFESDLFESDVSPSILPSNGDLSKLENIRPVRWTMRRSRYHQKLGGASNSKAADSSSSPHESSPFLSTDGSIPTSTVACPCSSLLWPNCPCLSNGIAFSPIPLQKENPASPTSPITPEPVHSFTASSDWAHIPIRRATGDLKLERRIMQLQMLRQQLREREQKPNSMNPSFLGRFQRFRGRLEKEQPASVAVGS